ncbi:fatty-acid amide hydrolase 2-B-like isoform X2 [Hylaeus anthracinus]|nr:fatty-acid amide hydrolase 2-B-like isoform X2 [Hylaeus anthracinus]
MLENEKPLFGIPFTVKESCSVAGLSLTGGYRKKKGMKALKDGALVQMLKRAGAIPLCVTNTSVLCLTLHSDNPIYGLSRNPYDTRRTAGGSSGGEGALLGAGASILGIGSDLMGSIRIPSLYNGVFGHKPTPGIIPNKGHMPDYSQISMFVQGPLARYAEDLILAVKVMSVDCDIPLHLDKPLDVKNLRIFYVENIESFCGIRSTTSDVRQSIRKALRYLSGNGARVEHISQDWVRNSATFLWSSFQDRELLKSLRDINYEEPRNAIFNYIKSMFGCGSESYLVSVSQMIIAHRGFLPLSKNAQYNVMKEKMRQNINNQLGSDGVFIYPTFPQPAPYHTAMNFVTDAINYATFVNVMDMPSTHVPMGLNNKGLPIGFQVMAGRNQDRLCLGVARELEKAFGGWVRPTS